MSKISVIVPCYNEQEALGFFYDEMNRVMNLMPYAEFELLFIDDGSRDGTLSEMKRLASTDERVKYLSFSRNFGKESAMYAGLKNATGDFVAIMDADLQDPPSLLPEMYKAVTEEGYDSVATRRVTRKGEPPVRSFFARLFYRICNKICSTDMVDGARDYRLMSRRFVNALLELSERNRFSKGLFGWVGFKTKWLEFENVERVAGETKWSFWKLFKYSIEGIVAFSTFPLTIAAALGFLGTAAGSVWLLVIAILAICGKAVSAVALISALLILLVGVQLLCLGIACQYIAKTYLEIKNRPIYITGDTNIK